MNQEQRPARSLMSGPYGRGGGSSFTLRAFASAVPQLGMIFPCGLVLCSPISSLTSALQRAFWASHLLQPWPPVALCPTPPSAS